jgi:predicted flavoprotein YhiN
MKRLVILGGGESGVGAALLGKEIEYKVFLSDAGKTFLHIMRLNGKMKDILNLKF